MVSVALARPLIRPAAARPGSAARRPAGGPAAPPRVVLVHYTSQTGRLGEGGEEEQSLRDSIAKMTSERQYGSTFRVGADQPQSQPQSRPVDEEKEPGFHHESRTDLEQRGAVVHEELGGGGHAGGHPSPASAPESGTEGRTPGSGAGTESTTTTGGGGGGGSATTTPGPGGSESEDYASAPESGTVRG